MKTPCTSPHNEWFHQIFSNDILNPGYKRKMLMRKRTSILDGICVEYEQLFHPIHCLACRICQSSSKDKLILTEVTGIPSFLDQLHYIWAINCFGNGTRQYWTGLYQSGSLHILFSYHYILSILGEIILIWNQSFQCPAFAAFQCWFFGKRFGSCEYNIMKSQFWF